MRDPRVIRPKREWMATTETPEITEELLAWLEAKVPEKSPARGTTVEDVRFDAGMRETVRLLATEFKRQQGTT